MNTCESCHYCGPDLDEPICHKHESTVLVPCPDWAPRGFDYDSMAQEAKREADSLRKQLQKLRAIRPETADEKLRLRKRIDVLHTMRIEQDSNYRLFSERAEERRLK